MNSYCLILNYIIYEECILNNLLRGQYSEINVLNSKILIG